MRFSFIFCCALFLFAAPAWAVTGDDITVGSACTVEDAVTVTANPSGRGAYILSCESSVWTAKPNAATPTASAHVATKQYADNAVTAGIAAGRTCTPRGPADCPMIGDQCNDTTIFAGYHPTLNVPIFAHPSNQSTGVVWSTVSVDTGGDSAVDGEVKQTWIKANTTITDYPPFKLCDDLNAASALGYTDWYLPSLAEMTLLYWSMAAINAGAAQDINSTNYWTSTEVSATVAIAVNTSNGNTDGGTKTTASTYDVRCIRRN